MVNEALLGILPKEVKISYVGSNIVGELPEEERDSANKRTTKILESYLGLDADILSILSYSAKRGRFDEFAGKLEEHYNGNPNLAFLDPGIRRLSGVGSAVYKVEEFFIKCYQELGIRPRK